MLKAMVGMLVVGAGVCWGETVGVGVLQPFQLSPPQLEATPIEGGGALPRLSDEALRRLLDCGAGAHWEAVPVPDELRVLKEVSLDDIPLAAGAQAERDLRRMTSNTLEPDEIAEENTAQRATVAPAKPDDAKAPTAGETTKPVAGEKVGAPKSGVDPKTGAAAGPVAGEKVGVPKKGVDAKTGAAAGPVAGEMVGASKSGVDAKTGAAAGPVAGAKVGVPKTGVDPKTGAAAGAAKPMFNLEALKKALAEKKTIEGPETTKRPVGVKPNSGAVKPASRINAPSREQIERAIREVEAGKAVGAKVNTDGSVGAPKTAGDGAKTEPKKAEAGAVATPAPGVNETVKP